MSATKPTVPIRRIDFTDAERVVADFSTERGIASVVMSEKAALPESRAARIITRSPTRKFTVDLPDYVIDAVHARTLQSKSRLTARFVILQALMAIGIDIKSEDLVSDGRRTSQASNSPPK